jgi:hypothetical protein
LKLIQQPACGGGDARAIHIQRTHVAHIRAHIPHLRFRELLQLLQLQQSGFPVALQNLAEDLQAHLDTDEALQRAIVKIGGNPLTLRLTRGFDRLLELGVFVLQTFETILEPPLLE